MDIKKSAPDDLNQILDIARGVGNFNQEEVDTVEELFQGYMDNPVKSGYNFISCYEAGEVVGFACWGPAALSNGAVDLYWICTSKHHHGKGIASQLFKEVVKEAREMGRWLMVIWTSSKPEYEKARAFYTKMGCPLEGRITDFYDRGDDLCIFTHRF